MDSAGSDSPQRRTALVGGKFDRYKVIAALCEARLSKEGVLKESWCCFLDEIAQDRIKWRGLIRRGAGEYEAKRIGETERKRSQRKARAKASPTDLSYSICKRQFRAKNGPISQFRTHKQ